MDDKIFVKVNGFFLRVIKIVDDDLVCKLPSYLFKYAVFTQDYDQPKHKLIVDDVEFTDVSTVWHTYVYGAVLYLVIHTNNCTFELE